MWPSFEAASRISVWANGALVCSLVAGVLATIAIVLSGNVKEAYWDHDRRQSQERIAELGAAVSEANARAAEANEKAEAERLARVKIEEKIAGRHLTPEQRQSIVDELKSAGKGYVTIRAPADDPERVAFASDIESAFRSAGWVTNRTAGWPPYAFWATGLAGLPMRSTGNSIEPFPASVQTAKLVSKVFGDAGWAMTFVSAKDPGSFGAGMPEAETKAPDRALLEAVRGEVEIVVGPRPP